MLPFAAGADAVGQSYTDLPELQSATVVSMRTSASSPGEPPPGITIAFRFDEPLAGNAPDPADFLVYNQAGVASQAAAAEVGSDVVTAFFPSVDTSAEADSLAVAVVEEGAVLDVDGGGNPVGTSALVVIHSQKQRGPKSCIRLIRADNLRHRLHRTFLNFVFTSFANCDDSDWASGVRMKVRHGKLHLEMTDGRSIPAMSARYRLIDARSNHRLIVTAIFPGKRVRRHISRVTARDAAVYYDWWGAGSDDSGYEYNWLQARPIAHRGNTARPDLVSVKLQPNQNSAQQGHAIFLFDQRVARPSSKRFRIDQLRGQRAVVVRDHPRMVRVGFSSSLPNGVANATDGSVQDRAVRGARADEVAIPNTVTSSTMTNGYTANPDIITSGSYADGSGPISVDVEFDAVLSGPPVSSAFHLYGPDGTKYDAQQCSLRYVNSSWDPHYVRCTFPSSARVSENRYQLATVDAGAVEDTNGRRNTEGATATYVTAAVE